MSTIEDAKKEIQRIREAHKDNRNRYHDLQLRRKELEEQIPSLKTDVSTAEENKHKILSLHVSGELSETEVQAARKAIDEAKKKLSDTHEIIDAMIKREAALKNDHDRLGADYANAIKGLWLLAYKKEKASIADGEKMQKVRRAYMMSFLAHGGGDFRYVLVDLFGDRPSDNESRKLAEDLKKEFLPEGEVLDT
jgi:chromosome segregation ATPase